LAEKLRSRRVIRNIGQSAIPAQTAPILAPVSAPEPVPEPAKPANLVSMPSPAAAAPSLPDDDERLTRDELIRARNTAQNALARIRGEYERHSVMTESQRKAIHEERDRLLADLAQAKKEAEDKSEQAEFEKSVTSKSAERLNKAV
jgi:hypothetical protein